MDEKVLSHDIDDYFIMSHKEMKNFSYSRVNNYQMVKEIIYSYPSELSEILKLERPYEMKRFFRDHNDKMLFFKNFFSDIQDNQLNYVIYELITNQIKLNLINAKKYLFPKHDNT